MKTIHVDDGLHDKIAIMAKEYNLTINVITHMLLIYSLSKGDELPIGELLLEVKKIKR